MKLRDKTNIEICKENNIRYTFLTNVVEERNTKQKIRATLQIISKILVGTLGPYGSTTIIQDREMKHFATKDGYDLMNKISFSEEVSRTVLDLVRQVASNQVLTVGDGSTSAIVVASALYSSLTHPKLKLFDKIAPKDVLDILKDLADLLENDLKESAKPLSDDLSELETVATIATNNDKESGKLIKEIYDKIGEFGFISTDIMEKREKDSYEIKQGIEWPRGYIDDYFAKNYENKKVIHDQEPRIFLTDSILTYNDIEQILSPVIGEVCGREKAELLIVANGYEEDVRTFLRANRTKHLGMSKTPEIIFTAVDIDQVTDTGKYDLEDLATLLGSEVYKKMENTPAEFLMKPERFIGRAEKTIITKKSTQIIGKELSEEVKKAKELKVNDLREKLKEKMNIDEPKMDDHIEMYQLRRRISSLTDSTAVISVAGKSMTERMTRERLIEDAILASKSAIRHGVIPGGNISIPLVLTYKIDEYSELLAEKYNYIPVEDIGQFLSNFMRIIKDAFLESYRNVLNNSYFTEERVEEVIEECIEDKKFYNLKNHKFETFEETDVINSVDTDIQILESVVSIIGIMATSNQMITINFSTNDQIEE